MNAEELIAHLSSFDIDLYLDGNLKLKAKSPKGAITSEIANLIKTNKINLIEYLKRFSEVVGKDTDTLKISPVERSEGRYQVSFAQQRLWFIDQVQGGTPEYNMPRAFNVKGHLDVSLLTEVLTQIIVRHEVLRTVYVEEQGEARQVIRALSEVDFTINEVGLTDLTGETQISEVKARIEADTVKAFDLTDDVMLRVSYLHTAEDAGVLVFNMHHIASDGWSMEVLTKEFFALYESQSQGKASSLAELGIQYVDYAHWQRTQLEGELLNRQLNYWAKQLDDISPVHSLPLSYSRPETKAHVGAIVRGSLSADVSIKLQTLAKKYQLTPFMLLHGALSLLLSRHSNSADIVIGTPIANRMQEELTPLIGFFVNTLVLRADTQHSTLSEYFSHIRQVHLDAQSNQDVPFDKLVERLNIPRSAAYTPLFQIMMTTNTGYGVNNDTDIDVVELSGATLNPFPSQAIQAKFDLEVNMSISDEGMGIGWIYDVSLFDEASVQRLNDHLRRLLIGLSEVENGDVAPHHLPMLSKEETYNLVTELNRTTIDYPKERCIHELFEQQAQDNPENVALVFEQSHLTFKELNKRANQLAHYLVERQGVKPDTLVGLYVEPSLEMVVGILGILKAGGAYVPLDPSYPKERLQYMIDDAGLTTIVSHVQVEEVLENYSGQIIHNEDEKAFQGYSTENLVKPLCGLTSSNLAYMIYTSGSTGRPKGVLIEHQSVCNYLTCVEGYLTENLEYSLMSTSLNFDATVTSLFGGWLKGKYAEVLGQKGDAFGALQSALESKAAGLYKVTPTHLKGLLFEEPILTPHVLVVGGEVLSNSLALKVSEQMPNTQFINEYGPTESTVGCSYHKFCYADGEVFFEEQNIHIGKPILNSQFYVLGQNIQLIPKGSIGELYIGGDGLARGYLNRPDLTAERFIHNPYFEVGNPNSSERLYRTGDLVRYLSDGNVEFVGRADDQVKIRGFRIELGEIEAQLSAQAGVDSALVLAKELAGSQQLVGYIKPATELDEDSRVIFLSEIKAKLSNHLPDYMVPSVFLTLAEWPLTPNGKVDNKALPQPNGSDLLGQYVAPETDTEKALVEIWSRILEIDAEKISVTANFFELGGHSLLVMRMKSFIKQKLEVSLDVAKLFVCPTVKFAAEQIDSEILKTKIELVSDKVEEGEVELLI